MKHFSNGEVFSWCFRHKFIKCEEVKFNFQNEASRRKGIAMELGRGRKGERGSVAAVCSVNFRFISSVVFEFWQEVHWWNDVLSKIYLFRLKIRYKHQICWRYCSLTVLPNQLYGRISVSWLYCSWARRITMGIDWWILGAELVKHILRGTSECISIIRYDCVE